MSWVRSTIAAWIAAVFWVPSFAAAAEPYAVGDRYFPPTPSTEDPFVADEVAFAVSNTRQGASDSAPVTRTTELTTELALRLTQDLGFSVEGNYLIVDPRGAANAYGFDNPEFTLKYQLYQNDPHEFQFSVGVSREFGGVGAARIGAEGVGSTTPTVYIGKGLGDLGEGLRYLRPLAVTGSFGYQISDHRASTSVAVDSTSGAVSLDSDHHPDMAEVGAAVEYSLRYLEGNVAYLGLPSMLSRMTPVIEFSLETPMSRAYGEPTVATLAPGLVYSGDRYYLGAEMLLPMTRQTGSGVGFIATFTARLDLLVPSLFGAPLLSPRGKALP